MTNGFSDALDGRRYDPTRDLPTSELKGIPAVLGVLSN